MHKSWKTRRRNFEAAFRMFGASARRKAEIQATLDLLRPYDVGIDLTRIGEGNDGGYLLPDDLVGIEALFSPGVSDEIGFDLAMMDRGIPAFLTDASVDGLVEDHELATFDKLFLGPRTEGQFISLDDWVARYAPDASDLLLQMDIEGAEWEVFTAASDAVLNRFRLVALELHNLHNVYRRKELARITATLERLSKHFVVVHLHPNNAAQPVSAAGFEVPPTLELALIRRDRTTKAVAKPSATHPLDHPNISHLPDYEMPVCWTMPDRA